MYIIASALIGRYIPSRLGYTFFSSLLSHAADVEAEPGRGCYITKVTASKRHGEYGECDPITPFIIIGCKSCSKHQLIIVINSRVDFDILGPSTCSQLPYSLYLSLLKARLVEES